MAAGNPIRIETIDHVVLRVRDVARAQAFYCGVLGCSVEKLQAELGLTQLRAGSSLIDLVDVAGTLGRAGGAAPGTQGRNMDHVCLRLRDFDAAAIRAHLGAHGIDAGQPVSRYGAAGQGPSIYIEDPEGNVVELKAPPGA